jgi:hypothetical protein
MSEGAGNHSRRSFRIEVELTDADIVAYQQIVLAKRRLSPSRFRWIWPAAIFGLPLLVGWLMVQGEIVHAHDEGFHPFCRRLVASGHGLGLVKAADSSRARRAPQSYAGAIQGREHSGVPERPRRSNRRWA